MSGKIYIARSSGLADYDGGQVYIQAGVTRVREGHPLLKGRESIFEEIEVQYEVEDARSAPQDEPKPVAPAVKTEPASKTEPVVKDPAPKTEPALKTSSHRRGPRKV